MLESLVAAVVVARRIDVRSAGRKHRQLDLARVGVVEGATCPLVAADLAAAAKALAVATGVWERVVEVEEMEWRGEGVVALRALAEASADFR